MNDTELYRQILGLEKPWGVERVVLDVVQGRVDVFVQHEPSWRWACPECERELPCFDHSEERVWRHLDTCQFRTLLHARIPRVQCPEHKVVQVRVPWAEARSRFTLLMERFVIDVLLQAATLEGARRIVRLSWDEVWGIMSRAVRRGLARKPVRSIRHLGVDEKAFRKGHRYMTVVCDLDRATVEHVSDARTVESLDEYWSTRSPEQLAAIEAVTMDMWAPYILSTLDWVPEARRKIVFDRFHIMKHVGEALDAVRKQEHRELAAQGRDALKRTKYLWLRGVEKLSAKQRNLLTFLRNLGLKVGRAWTLKESLRHLWDYRSPTWAGRFFRQWFWRATHSRLEPMRQLAHRLRRFLPNILTYCRHRLTNAVAEGLNSKIMAIKRRACGFRNPDHFKHAIHFYCGGLDLYPR